MSTDHDDLIQRITAFRERHGIAPTVFGKLAIGDSSLVPEMIEKGRKPQAMTRVKIAEFMTAYEAKQAEVDAQALALIERCGFVMVEDDGLPRLTSHTQIHPRIFDRLVADGRLIPNGDAMFGDKSQTYRVAEAAHAAA
jgi:hypothetical protein